MKTKKVTHIEGRRWFQRTYGNTYHSVKIHFDDGGCVLLDKTYGYGDHYLQRAVEWLQAAQHLPNENGAPSRLLREAGISYSVMDVAREKDL